jgi:hypothetical protein
MRVFYFSPLILIQTLVHHPAAQLNQSRDQVEVQECGLDECYRLKVFNGYACAPGRAQA